MRKIAALGLVLLMVLTMGTSFAETLKVTPGAPEPTSTNQFFEFFNVLAGSENPYINVFTDDEGTEGDLQVITAYSMDGLAEVKVYHLGNVCYAVLTVSQTMDPADSNLTQDLRNFDQWIHYGTLGLASAINLSVYPDVMTAVDEDPQLSQKFDDAAVLDMENSIVTGNVVGLPYGREITVVEENGKKTLTVTTIVASMDSKIEIE